MFLQMTRSIRAANKTQTRAKIAAIGERKYQGKHSCASYLTLIAIGHVTRGNLLFHGCLFRFLTNKDIIACRSCSVKVVGENPHHGPDRSRVNGENEPHVFVKDRVFHDKPATNAASLSHYK